MGSIAPDVRNTELLTAHYLTKLYQQKIAPMPDYLNIKNASNASKQAPQRNRHELAEVVRQMGRPGRH